MRKIVLMLIVGLIATSGLARPAVAIMSFHKEFIKLYLGENSDPDSDLAKLVKEKKLKCLICHQGKKKKHHNPYGEHFEALLDKKKDKKDTEKIIAALKKVGAMHSDPNDENSPTYDELIKAGKLPGGSLEDLKKEPPKSEEAKKSK